MTWTVWAAIVIVILTVAALIKRYETRLVLLASGFLMTCLSLDPMQGLNAFAKSMTNSGLIMAICSAMGFAFVVQMTKCDVHLVKLLSAPDFSQVCERSSQWCELRYSQVQTAH